MITLTVLGGCGAWPAAGQACSGYLIEHEGFRLLVDPGYATLPRLLELVPAAGLDVVLVSHGHPDQCRAVRSRAHGIYGCARQGAFAIPTDSSFPDLPSTRMALVSSE
ncbi:MBL fold metallo-hydrolase [Sphaerisporangium sp. NPDC088356]|uniref:MBL fold metallo-hydrolase n=1 Tax=Sphaerisporangium sp. NPDC088356 TaxID=3154871 RepID=UPI0034464398